MPRGRQPGFRMTQEHRAKIKNSNILNALLEHIEGTREMGSTQVTAGLGLLRKVLPDLSKQEVSGPDDGPIEATVDTRDLARAIIDILGSAKVET